MSVFKVFLSEDGRVTRTEQEGAIFSRSNLVNTLRVYSPYPSDYLIRAGFTRTDGVKVHSVFLFYVGQHEGYSLYEYNLTGDQVGSHGALAVALNLYKANQDALLTTATFTIQVGTSFEPLVEPEPDDDDYYQLIDGAMTRFQAAIDLADKEIDAKPTVGSQNLVTSGGTFAAISEIKANLQSSISSLGVKNKVVAHTVFKSQNIVPTNGSTDFYVANLADLPVSSADEIIGLAVQYKLLGQSLSFRAVANYNRETVGEYNHYLTSSETISWNDIAAFTNMGYTVDSNATTISVSQEVPPILFKVYKDKADTISFRAQFARNGATSGVAYNASGMCVGVQKPYYTANDITKVTINRIDIIYLASEVKTDNPYSNEMTTYQLDFDAEQRGAVFITAPAGLQEPYELNDWLVYCGYTSAEQGCPVSELLIEGTATYDAVVYANTNGLYLSSKTYGNFALDEINGFYEKD